MEPKFFIVNLDGYILPIPYDNYETALANCESNEVVYLAETAEELELSLETSEETDLIP